MSDVIDSPGAQDTIVTVKDFSGGIQQGEILRLDGLLPELTYHKIFLFCETVRAATATADYFVRQTVQVYRNGRIGVSLPASVGQDVTNTLISQSLASVFPCLFINATSNANVPCSPAQEGITLSLSKAFTSAVQAIVGYQKFVGSLDRLSLNVEAFGVQAGFTISNYRAVLGVISTANGF